MTTPQERFLAMPFLKSRIEDRDGVLVRIETRQDPYTGLKLTAVTPVPTMKLPPYRGRQTA